MPIKIPKIEIVPIDSIRKNPNNPRIIKDENFKKLVKSIKGFPQMMFIRPIVVRGDMIIGGNMRYEGCIAAGKKKIPVIRADSFTDDQAQEFIIKDNIPGGEWDWSMLANDWDQDLLIDWGFDTGAFGIEGSGKDDGLDLKEVHKIEIDCNDETTQEKIYNEMTERGFKCRLLTL
jgi:ParB-like chromosome segregation protein Spo0J